MKGTLYGIGVGPGDPELMTLKAVRMIKECQVVAIPHLDKNRCVAYGIALGAVPEIEEKTLLCVDVPMTKNKERLEECRIAGANALAKRLEQGEDVALLTLGDSSIYASCMYLLKRVEKLGYDTCMINGIPSFCAAAARLSIPLAEQSEEIHILPASYPIEEGVKLPGVKVLMKTGSCMGQVKKVLSKGNYQVSMVEQCGMPGEKVYHSLEAIPEEAGYYSLLIVRNLD